jgi:hypothetical protein
MTQLWWKRSCQGTPSRVVRPLVPRAKQQSDAYGTSSAAGYVGVARTGSRITRTMQPSATRGETSGPRPDHERGPRAGRLLLSLREHQWATLATFDRSAARTARSITVRRERWVRRAVEANRGDAVVWISRGIHARMTVDARPPGMLGLDTSTYQEFSCH